MNTTPANKQAALFLTRKNRIDTMQEALDQAINTLLRGDFNQALANGFNGDFGPEPVITFKLSVRRDVKEAGKFVCSTRMIVSHDVGNESVLYGLKP